MKKLLLKKMNWRKGIRFMYWTFYSQNGICWLESDKGDYLKVHDEDHAKEIIKNQKQFGWDYELIL